MARSETSARGRRRRSATTPCSWSGRTRPAPACDAAPDILAGGDNRMQRRFWTFVTLGLACAIGAPALAQKITPIGQGGGGSPHVRSEWTVEGAAITLEYGRPFLKGRPESQMMPAGEPWRTGADEASI